MTDDEVRQAFLGFFKEKGHRIIPSSSLVPHGDPTLLLTSAGMVQFKPYFLGQEVPPHPCMASCQKCFRTTDIESVGDSSHLTFFEMLGNFSVGDYFKEGAISLALEFVLKRLSIPKERLWITIFLDDDEAFDIWRRNGITENRIIRFGEEENFWGPAGDSGPCGPSSEIHYDFGEEVGCGKPSCGPNCECGRFSEIWNLVFVQYNQDKEGKRNLLTCCHIDTGMGLERTAAVMQGKTSVYETDFFTPLIQLISRLSGRKYGEDDDSDNNMRVVAEHSRGITFLITDGVLPDNEGRGYVLRRLLRRAALFGRRLGLEKPFLSELVSTTISQMGGVYPELVNRRDFILKVVEGEEARFNETLSIGLGLLDDTVNKVYISVNKAEKEMVKAFEAVSKNKPKTIEANEAIKIVKEAKEKTSEFVKALELLRKTPETLNKSCLDDVGFKLKIAQQYCDNSNKAVRIAEIAERDKTIINGLKELNQIMIKAVGEKQFKINGKQAFKLYDTYGFPLELTREIAEKRGFSVDMEGFEKEMEKQREKARASHRFELAGESGLEDELELVATTFVGYKELKQKSVIQKILVDNKPIVNINEKQEAGIVLETTPFYAEMGGQVGDTGEIIGASGRFIVNNTLQLPQSIVFHQGYVAEGNLSVNDEVEALVDCQRRLDIARNHTATHLLQFVLRRVLGEHVQQRGSLVAADRLRFDFSHLVAMTGEELDEVQRIVNQKIRQNLPVYDEDIRYEQAIEEGAIALFDEKYGGVVRVLRIGRPAVSVELCGGTHVSASGEIGLFRILTESSIGGGLRRIEAVTGRGAEEMIEQKIDTQEGKLSAMQAELEAEQQRVKKLERELARQQVEALLQQVEVINDVKFVSAAVPLTRPEMLREIADLLRDKLKSVVVVLGIVYEGKPAFLAAVTPDLVKKGYHAGQIVKQVAAVAGGSGGGKPDLAQGGGKDKNKLNEALNLVRSLI